MAESSGQVDGRVKRTGWWQSQADRLIGRVKRTGWWQSRADRLMTVELGMEQEETPLRTMLVYLYTPHKSLPHDRRCAVNHNHQQSDSFPQQQHTFCQAGDCSGVKQMNPSLSLPNGQLYRQSLTQHLTRRISPNDRTILVTLTCCCPTDCSAGAGVKQSTTDAQWNTSRQASLKRFQTSTFHTNTQFKWRGRMQHPFLC